MKQKNNKSALSGNGQVKLLMYAGTLFLVVLSILTITAIIFVMEGDKSYERNTISVTGNAEVEAVPDVANFSFTVKGTAKTTKEAQDIISEKVSNILSELNNLKVDEKDIKTESYTIYPKYEYVRVDQKQEEIAVDGTVYFPGQDRKKIQVGFDVSQNVLVKLRDLDQVSDALTVFAKEGVENLYGPNFQIDEPDELQDQARALAIDEAKDKAQQLAKDLGVHLGKVVSFDEGGRGYYPEQYYAKSYDMGNAAMVPSFAPELPTGENTISSNVTIIYSIK